MEPPELQDIMQITDVRKRHAALIAHNAHYATELTKLGGAPSESSIIAMRFDAMFKVLEAIIGEIDSVPFRERVECEYEAVVAHFLLNIIPQFRTHALTQGIHQPMDVSRLLKG